MSQKKLSLQEQLLQSGLVSPAQAKTAKTEKHKQKQNQRNQKKPVVDEARELALKAQQEKLEKDREMNRLRQEGEAKKQLVAQIKQLVQEHRLLVEDSDIDQYDDSSAYHFTDDNRVKKLFVPPALRTQIAEGRIAIVKIGKRYELVPADVAGKIRERDSSFVIVLNEPKSAEEKGNDPYDDYPIPDDLVW